MRNIFDRIIEPTIFAFYWFSGGFIGTWFTPWPLQVGLAMMIVGLAIYLAIKSYEDRGYYAPGYLGCALIVPPSWGYVIGGCWLMLRLLGLV